MKKSGIKQNTTVVIVSFLALFGLWNTLRWQAILNLPFVNIPLWGGFMLSTGVALIFLGIFYYGNWLIGDTRRLYQISNQRLNIPSIRWVRFLNPIGPFYHLYQHKDLLRQFMRRDIEGRYKGSLLGMIWSFINPLVMLIIYSFIFSIVFKARWRPQGEANLGEFAITLFAGLIAFNIFSETVNRAPGLIIANPNYVKKVIFPLEILPVSTLGATLFHGLISVVILISGKLLIMGTLSPMILLLPLVILPLLWLTLGLSWILASLGVFLRDTGYAIGIITQILFFMSPIFYPIEAIPQKYRFVLRINPLSGILENFRYILIWDRLPDLGGWFIQVFISLAIFVIGYMWFMKTKPGFADVV
jgi:lipopolysaccharide transport system permease protein